MIIYAKITQITKKIALNNELLFFNLIITYTVVQQKMKDRRTDKLNTAH